MSFSRMMTDNVKVVKLNGKEFGPYKASVQRKKIFLMQSEPLIESGDTIIRIMSNGGTEKYKVVDPGFYETFGGIKAHYQMQVEKEDIISKLDSKKTASRITNNFYGPNSRFNNDSVDNSTNIAIIDSVINQHINDLQREIEKFITDENEKNEALEIVDEIRNQFESGSPKKSIIKSLLSAIPQLGNIASIGSFILNCCTGS